MKYKDLPIIFLCITIILLLIIFLFRDEIGEIKVDGSQKTPLSNSNIEEPPIPAISIKKDKNKLHHVQETVIKEQNFDNFELPTSPTKEQFMKNFEDSVSDGMEIDNVGGFGDFGKKIHSDDPKTTISISDLPPDLGNQLRDELSFKENNKYEKTTDEDVYNEKESLLHLSGTTREIPHLAFELSIIPSNLEVEYKYKGYIYPKSVTKNDPPSYVSVKRVYKNIYEIDYIVINEETLKDGSSHVITEFVNASVQGCPAILGEKRAPSGAGYGAINWASSNYSYTITPLYAENQTDGLLELANQLAVANASTHQCSKSVSLHEETHDEGETGSLETGN